MQTLGRDWWGNAVVPAPELALVVDPHCLWLLAQHRQPAHADPAATTGAFHEGLWRFDVAELFIAAAQGPRYLEFNLSPHGAWWGAAFSSPRQRDAGFLPPAVLTHTALDAEGWRAALGIPLDVLDREVAFHDGARANATMILGSPAQRFFSMADLGPGEPDFHRPDRFERIAFREIR